MQGLTGSCRQHGSHFVLRELIAVIRSWRWAGFELIEKGHDCMENAVPYTSDGVGHGWDCGRCGKWLQRSMDFSGGCKGIMT